MKWYRKAAEQGNADAQFGLAIVLGGDKLPVPYTNSISDKRLIDIVEGGEWCRKAAEQGHVGAQKLLALCYEEGKGFAVARDAAEAVKWYRKAVDPLSLMERHNLAVPLLRIYEDGRSVVARDATEALETLRGFAHGTRRLQAERRKR